MAYDINFEKGGTGVVLDLTGFITGKDILEANEKIYIADQDKKLRYQIWDFLQADRLDMSVEEIHEVALQDKAEAAENPEQLVAIVGFPDVLNGADVTYHLFAEFWLDIGFPSKTFVDLNEARKWIVNVYP